MTDPADRDPPAAGTGRIKADRLSPQDWFDAGIALVARDGPAGLRIDKLCSAMKVTKGSFYWHFQDRQDFLLQLFDHWRRRETTGLIERVEALYSDPVARIWHVVEFVTLGSYDVGAEVAMRQWGHGDAHVRHGLEQVDAERLGFFSRQFEACGFAPDAARTRAISVYAFTLSCGYMLTGESPEALETRLRQGLDLLLAPA
ncbi:TetR/AcrR family transcriptional regulator [Pseudodonghicola flavimaris]|uniref:TetR/AcrR family transcriptional regulator n=1 Tax=Pseudodonghicola flavimaris TaxID=3050036 RepID=A0ABT7F1F1_9RHOB|nr:TetR/AcrR family transcriptional regulator [Pseudodonghicola flavimaris]MDK3018405.1 TetR/AcrR family transcriptional regulator [Pseudodonghicola flavimaris]